jgi:hypothetical protein
LVGALGIEKNSSLMGFKTWELLKLAYFCQFLRADEPRVDLIGPVDLYLLNAFLLLYNASSEIWIF